MIIDHDHQTEYSTSSESKAMKKPRIVRNMTAFAVNTSPQAPPSIMEGMSTIGGVGVVLVPGATVVVVVLGGGGGSVPGALANTMGKAKADTTIPVVMNQANSLQGLELESSLCLLDIKVGRGDRR